MDDIKPKKSLRQPANADKLPFRPQRPASLPTPVQPTPSSKPHKEPAGDNNPLLPAEIPKRWRKKWWIIGGIVTVILLLFGLVGGAWWWYTSALQPRSNATSRIHVVIDQGSTPDAIAKELQDKGVIKSAFAFGLLTKQANARDKLQAGNYLFSPTQSAQEVLDWLVAGKVDTFNVTILPGKTLAEIKEKLVKDGFKAAEVDAAFAKYLPAAEAAKYPLLAAKPDGVNIEGYIYPETYQITSETTVDQLLQRAFDEVYKQIQAKGLKEQLATHGFSLHQGITLASIVQMEVSKDTDRRQVAQVFEKRLSQDMELGADPTFVYAAKQTGQTPTS